MMIQVFRLENSRKDVSQHTTASPLSSGRGRCGFTSMWGCRLDQSLCNFHWHAAAACRC